MGMWKRCSQCGGKIQIIPMIRIKESEPEKEAWACRACKTLEVHPVVPTEKDIEKREKAREKLMEASIKAETPSEVVKGVVTEPVPEMVKN